MRKEIVDISAGGILLLLSIAGFTMASQLGNGQSYGPDFFPKLVLLLLAFTSILLVGSALIGLKRKSDSKPIQIDMQTVGKILLFIVLLVAYILLFFVTGFIVSTFLFLLAAQWIFGIRKLVLLGTVSVAVPITLYFVFTLAFKIPLP